MCSRDDPYNPQSLNSEFENLKISDNLETCEELCKNDEIMLNDDLNNVLDMDNLIYKAFKAQTPVIPAHRQNLLEKSTETVQNIFNDIGGSKIADVINVEGEGPVYIGHVINITEQVMLDPHSKTVIANGATPKDYDQHFEIVDRRHWLAQPAVSPLDPLKYPAKYVIICHTASDEAFTQAENVLMLNMIQSFHIEGRGWADIAYNFCIGSDGNVYEGRGWFKEGSHTVTYNPYSVGIAFIGCFLTNLPPPTSLKRCKALIRHGVDIGAISPDYELLAHCQCRPFTSPGTQLADELKTWDHFNPDIDNTKPCAAPW